MFPTPTPIAIGTPQYLTNVDVNQFGQDMATGMIQGWNFFNTQSFSDLVWIMLLILIVIVGIISIRKHLEAV
ncbi:MAG TPA: hypothetical protein VLK33_23000 [Terriglobales bacterium]|nr:hypothetical protein [Terriglobales bacterium]